MADLRHRGGKGTLSGVTESGVDIPIAATGEGHLEVAIHAPRLPFGSIHTESIEPIFQHDAIYGINTSTLLSTVNGTGSVTAANSAFVCQSGTGVYGAGTLQSRRRMRYRPGQGNIGRFTALFTSPVADSYQIAGLGHPEDGVYFGYKGTTFGILYGSRGVREIRTFTVTTASTTNENITVTLNTTNTTVVAVTNSGSTVKTAYEISQGAYVGWKAEQIGSTVVFVRDAVGTASGTYSITATTAVVSVAQTLAGVALTEQFITQAEWNGDKLDGTGLSGVTLDPTKFNVFQIGIQYLGAGAITFHVETSLENSNAEWTLVHTMLLPNTLTATSFGNPSFPFTMSAYSNGSTTNLAVKSGSFAGFIEGVKINVGPRFNYTATRASVTAAAYQAIITIRAQRIFGGRTNQTVINLLSIVAGQQHNNPNVIYLIRNATLAGTPNFAIYSTNSASCVDTSATTCTFSTNEQVIWSGVVGGTGQFTFQFEDEITLQPGETLTVAARTAFGTADYTTVGVTTREDS